MCGIAGFQITSTRYPVESWLELLLEVQHHRGPEARGRYLHPSGQIGLAHNRLSILDIRPEGNQPMFDRSGRYAIVHNGEVYNYMTLARELNLSPRTHTDTEVLVEAFAVLGPRFVERCTGMFAFAILDTETKKLYLFRDRSGIKPLFFYQTEDCLVFASELKAIRALNVPLTLRPQALSSYLNLGTIPGPGTVFQEVTKLLPGYWCEIPNPAEITLHPYWELDRQVLPTTHYSDELSAQRALTRLLEEVVAEQLISDVPLGCFLSGGTDSSLITALASRMTTKPVSTFTIGFDDPSYNEASHAARVAEYLKTDHHQTIVTEADGLTYLDRIHTIYDEPFGSVSVFPSLVLCEQARKHLTVALAGDGGDEAFLGYGRYRWARRLQNPLVQLARSLLFRLFRQSTHPYYHRVAFQFSPRQELNPVQQIFSVDENFFHPVQIKEILPNFPDPERLPLPNTSLHGRRLSPPELQCLLDYHYHLPDDLLVKMDRASMYHSLEVRVPLMDHRIIEFAINLPVHLRYHPQKGMKYLLRQVLYSLVPRALVDRPKWGFPAPMANWLRGPLRFLLETEMSPTNLKNVGLYHPPAVQRLIQLFLGKNHTYLGTTLWLLVELQRWYQMLPERIRNTTVSVSVHPLLAQQDVYR